MSSNGSRHHGRHNPSSLFVLYTDCEPCPQVRDLRARRRVAKAYREAQSRRRIGEMRQTARLGGGEGDDGRGRGIHEQLRSEERTLIPFTHGLSGSPSIRPWHAAYVTIALLEPSPLPRIYPVYYLLPSTPLLEPYSLIQPSRVQQKRERRACTSW